MFVIPDLIKLNDYDGDWNRYLEVLYDVFKKDFIYNNLYFDSCNVVCIKDPYYQGKEASFWHLITEGDKEDERMPDMRRCERIKWPRVVIDNYNDDKIRIWETERKNKKGKKQRRVCLCLDSWDYLVVLTKRRNYYIFWTAYPVQRDSRKVKLKKEHDEYCKKTNAAP